MWFCDSLTPKRRIILRARTVGRVGLFREETCTFLDAVCNLTATWQEFLRCLNARNYFIIPQTPIIAVVSNGLINHVVTYKSP